MRTGKLWMAALISIALAWGAPGAALAAEGQRSAAPSRLGAASQPSLSVIDNLRRLSGSDRNIGSLFRPSTRPASVTPGPAAPGSSGALALPIATLLVNGTIIPYRDVRGGTTPDSGAGLWLGSDDTTDGSWGYFVGHNPGSFSPVRNLGIGSSVALRDRAGRSRIYTVRTVFTVKATATWKTIAARVTGYGESIVMQTCSGDGATNIIIVAA